MSQTLKSKVSLARLLKSKQSIATALHNIRMGGFSMPSGMYTIEMSHKTGAISIVRNLQKNKPYYTSLITLSVMKNHMITEVEFQRHSQITMKRFDDVVSGMEVMW